MSVEGQKGASQDPLVGQRSLEVERSFGEKLGESERRKGRKTTGKGRENDRRKTGERKLIKEGGKGCKSLTEGRKEYRSCLDNEGGTLCLLLLVMSIGASKPKSKRVKRAWLRMI